MSTTVGLARSSSKPSAISKSYSSAQAIRTEVDSLIKKHFSSTLGTIQDVTKLVMACIYKESAFNLNANSGIHGESQLKKFLGFPNIAAKMRNPATTQQERVNLRNSVAGFGLMQATGWYLIKGASSNGTSELLRMRSDLAGDLIVEPGTDINTVLGPNNLANQILVGLIILEDKYKIAPAYVSNPPTGARPYSNRAMATFGLYLGKGMDKFNSTPQAYAASILYGDSYKVANGPGASMPGNNNGNLVTGPATTIASGDNRGPAGC
jgi:hypothetical protein